MDVWRVESSMRECEEQDNREQRSRLLLAIDVRQERRQERTDFTLRHNIIVSDREADLNLSFRGPKDAYAHKCAEG